MAVGMSRGVCAMRSKLMRTPTLAGRFRAGAALTACGGQAGDGRLGGGGAAAAAAALFGGGLAAASCDSDVRAAAVAQWEAKQGEHSWLEEVEGPRALAFATGENAKTAAALGDANASPTYAKVRFRWRMLISWWAYGLTCSAPNPPLP